MFQGIPTQNVCDARALRGSRLKDEVAPRGQEVREVHASVLVQELRWVVVVHANERYLGGAAAWYIDRTRIDGIGEGRCLARPLSCEEKICRRTKRPSTVCAIWMRIKRTGEPDRRIVPALSRPTAPHYLQVGGDDTLIASDEIDLTQPVAWEQRSRGEVGAARAPLWTQSTKASTEGRGWYGQRELGSEPTQARPDVSRLDKTKRGVAIATDRAAAPTTSTGSALSRPIHTVGFRHICREDEHVRSIHPPPNVERR